MTTDETMAAIILLRQANRFAEAVSHYAQDAVMVAAPGQMLIGRDAVEQGMAALGAQFPSFEITGRISVLCGKLALHHSTWVAKGIGPDGRPTEATGRTADVLHRQDDGRWMVVIDNPWGTAILDA